MSRKIMFVVITKAAYIVQIIMQDEKLKNDHLIKF